MDNYDRSYRCNVCNKYYSSYKSLWNHNNKFHINNNTNVKMDVKNEDKNVKNVKSLTCELCNKIFNTRGAKSMHKKICQHKKDNIETEKLKKQIEVLELENKNLKNLTKNKKQNKNIINNINNGTINNKNIIINQFGSESVLMLSKDDIKNLASSNFNALVDIVKLLNFNEDYPENHNFCTTSLEGDYVNVLNTENNQIEKINKIDFYNNVLSKSIDKVNQILVLLEFDENYEQIKPKYLTLLETIVKDPTIFSRKNNIMIYNKNINQLSYNNKDIVLNTWNKLMQEPLDDNEESVFTDITI